MNEKKGKIKIRVGIGEGRIAEQVLEEVNRAIKDGRTITGVNMPTAGVSTVYLEILWSKTVGRSRDFFDAGFSSKGRCKRQNAVTPTHEVPLDFRGEEGTRSHRSNPVYSGMKPWTASSRRNR